MTTRKTLKENSADGVVNLNVHRADSLARENRALRRRLAEWLKNSRHSDRILSATHKVARMLLESPPNSDWRISAERILKTGLGVAICRIIFFDDAPRESFDAIRKLKKPRRAAALLSGIDFPNAKNMRDFLHLPIIRKGRTIGAIILADKTADAFDSAADDYAIRLAELLAAAPRREKPRAEK